MSTSPASNRFDDGTLRHATPCGGGGRQSRPAGILRREAKLKPLVEASGGGLMWLSDNPDPDIRSVRPGRAA
jgi:hypothetical protein